MRFGGYSIDSLREYLEDEDAVSHVSRDNGALTIWIKDKATIGPLVRDLHTWNDYPVRIKRVQPTTATRAKLPTALRNLQQHLQNEQSVRRVSREKDRLIIWLRDQRDTHRPIKEWQGWPVIYGYTVTPRKPKRSSRVVEKNRSWTKRPGHADKRVSYGRFALMS